MTRKLALKVSAAVFAIWLLAAYGFDVRGGEAPKVAPSPRPAAPAPPPVAKKRTPQRSAAAAYGHGTTPPLLDPGMMAAAPGARADRIDPSEPSPEPLPKGPSALETMFSEESHDEARTVEMQSYLEQSALAADLDPSIVQETDCGANVCRAVLAFAHETDAFTFASSAQNSDLRYEVRMPAVPVALSPEDQAAATPIALPPDAVPSRSAESGPMKVEILLARRELGAEDEPQPATP